MSKLNLPDVFRPTWNKRNQIYSPILKYQKCGQNIWTVSMTSNIKQQKKWFLNEEKQIKLSPVTTPAHCPESFGVTLWRGVTLAGRHPGGTGLRASVQRPRWLKLHRENSSRDWVLKRRELHRENCRHCQRVLLKYAAEVWSAHPWEHHLGPGQEPPESMKSNSASGLTQSQE